MALKHLFQNPALDGGVLGWKNCFPTCTAMQIAFETGGAKHPSGGDVRGCIRLPNGLPDLIGGTSIAQNVAAAKACWGVTLDHQQMPFEQAWQLGKRADVAVSIAIWYGVISGTAYDGSPGFRDNHQIILSGGKVYDTLADGRRPGIPDGAQPWPKSLLLRAAGRVNVAAAPAYRALGDGTALVVLAYAPKEQLRKYSVALEKGNIYIYDKAADEWRRERDSFPKNTSAPSTAPFTIPWAGGRKRVVELTAGRLDGMCVEPGATHVRLVVR